MHRPMEPQVTPLSSLSPQVSLHFLPLCVIVFLTVALSHLPFCDLHSAFLAVNISFFFFCFFLKNFLRLTLKPHSGPFEYIDV